MSDRLDFTAPAETFALRLLGAELTLDGVGGRIVEVEAYDVEDPASHSFTGPSRRNAAMFGPPGRAYVYRIYGMHLCLNVVCGPQPGAAVLIRALEPTRGVDLMRERRGMEDVRRLCSGPGRLCQALGVTLEHDHLPIDAPPFALSLPPASPAWAVGPRIGITKAADVHRRYGVAGSAFLSRPFAKTG